MYSLLIVAAANTLAKDEAASGLAGKIASFFDYIISQVPGWIAGLILFVLSFAVAKIAKVAVESRISDKVDEEHQEVLVLAGRVSYFGTLVVGITIALKVAGIDLTTILAAVAFGIGFALQDLIMNFLSGVLLLLNRQFTIGDYIRVGSTYGKVMEIQTRATIIKSIDGTKVIVPNATIFRSEVISYTTNPTRRVTFDIPIAYDTNLKYATHTIISALKANTRILKKPAPSVIVKEYGDSAVNLQARFWVGSRDGWYQVKSQVMHDMFDTLGEAGIEIPFNIMHIETETDTRGNKEEMAKIRDQRIAEMKISKALEKEAAKNQAAPAAQPVTAPIAVTEPGAAAPSPETPSGAQIAVTAGVPSNTDPSGAYEDTVEIDGQG